MSFGSIFKVSSTKLGVSCKSRLYEAAETLRNYLYLSRTSNINDVIIQSAGTVEITNNASKEIALQQERLSQLREILIGSAPAPKADVESAADEASKDSAGKKKDTSVLGVGSVQLIGPSDFYNGILTGVSSGKKQSDITHICITDTGQSNNFSARGAEYVAVFSNLIPAVELSKCVPYFNMRLIQNIPNDGRVKMPFLVLESFLGATRKNQPSSFLGGTDIPDATIVSPIEKLSSKLNTTVSGMELFQSPQTLIRPSINTSGNYKSNRGITALDPMQPLASIESVNFDVSALSQNFMTTNTKIDISIVLHDKSRLAELSPLVSPGVYPTVQAEIEWGWSHPDSNLFSVNPYSKFLNALRNKQIFCVSSVSFSNRDATSLSIRIQLTGLGEYIASSTSIYTGDFVSYELIRAKMNQLFTIIDERAKDGEPPKQKFIGAYEQTVSLSNWESSDKWILYDHYRKLTDMIDSIQGGQGSVSELVDFYTKVLNGTVPTAQQVAPVTPPNVAEYLRDTMRLALSGGSIQASPYINAVYGGTPDTPSTVTNYLVGILDDMFIDAGNVTVTQAKGPSEIPTEEAIIGPSITFGDAFYRCFTVPMSLTDVYDEIRVTTFDFNDHAGKMGGINIGAFPFIIPDVLDALIKPKMTSQKAAQELIKLVNNAAAVPYGVKKALIAKSIAEKQLAEDDAASGDSTNAQREAIQAIFEEELANIYEIKAQQGLGVGFEPKFTVPRIKMHTEVSNVMSGGSIKQILNVFIYDDANTGYRGTNLISSIMQQDSGIVRIFNTGKEIQILKSEKTAGDPTSVVSLDRAQAKKIITSAIPTLRIGTEGSLITNASYSSSAAGDLANINLLRGIKNSGGASGAGTFPGIDADLFVIPTTLTITMAGMPIVNRGQTYFVDFGTGTTLDNTYTVMSVKHSMKLGNFTTTLLLNVTNQGSIKSVTSKIQTDLKLLQKYSKTSLPADKT